MAPSKKITKKTGKIKGFRGVQRQKIRGFQQKPHTSVAGRVAASASTRKLMLNNPNTLSEATTSSSELKFDYYPEGYRLVDLRQLADALKSVTLCKGAFIKLKESTTRRGLDSELVLACSACGKGPAFHTSANITARGKSAEVNRRIAYAAMEVGLGREGVADMCSILNMPPPSAGQAFNLHLRTVFQSSEEEAEQQMSEAVSRARRVVVGGGDVEDRVVDLAVTFDGTWAKRGFKSNFGVGVVISADTGEVLDREVLSKVCDECSARDNLDKEGENYRLWWEGHKGVCKKNFSGSSPAMEAYAAKVMWGRSVSKHKVRYIHMVCDGDSKAFNDVKHMYGEGEGDAVVKLDCIGHVGKRMFRALDKLRKETKGKLSDGKSVGGWKGRLTGGQNGMVARLSEHYRNAIKKNIDREALLEGGERLAEARLKMQEAILAVLYHEVKLSDNTVRHQYCPPDDCEYKKSGTMNDKDYHLDEVFLDLLLPTFQRLSEASLVERCIPGYTQNQNESFNSLIWKRCPKHLWRGPLSVKTATNLAVLQFNSGALTGRNRILRSLGLQEGHHTTVANIRKDKLRMAAADRECEEAAKKKRKAQKKQKTVQEDEKLEQEGVTYESGAF